MRETVAISESEWASLADAIETGADHPLDERVEGRQVRVVNGYTVEQLRARGHRVDQEMLEESAEAGLLEERRGYWFWTERAERAFGEAFQTMPAVQP